MSAPPGFSMAIADRIIGILNDDEWWNRIELTVVIGQVAQSVLCDARAALRAEVDTITSEFLGIRDESDVSRAERLVRDIRAFATSQHGASAIERVEILKLRALGETLVLLDEAKSALQALARRPWPR